MRAVFATRAGRYVVLKALLEDRRRDIQEELRSLREALLAEIVDVKDAEEQSLDDLMRELDFALMEMKSDTLRQIDAAIRRLEGGTYGVCVECGRKIAEGRLQAVPFVRLCRVPGSGREPRGGRAGGPPSRAACQRILRGVPASERRDHWGPATRSTARSRTSRGWMKGRPRRRAEESP